MKRRKTIIPASRLYSTGRLFESGHLRGLENPKNELEVSLRNAIERKPSLRRKIVLTHEMHIESGNIKHADFLHSVLCQVAMPRQETAEKFFQRISGGVYMRLEAGQIFLDGKLVEQPLPYGVKPRLIMIHLISEAVRNRTPVVEVGRSIREFLNMLKLDLNGRSYHSLQAQIHSLAASRLTLGMHYGNKDITIQTNPIRKFEAWASGSSGTSSDWNGTIELSQDFFESIQQFAVPLDTRALGQLSRSALALDIYTWLAYRLCQIKDPDGVFVSWRSLHDQFGQEYAQLKDFKREFHRMLVQVGSAYPEARFSFDKTRGGLQLYNSPPPIPKKQIMTIYG